MKISLSSFIYFNYTLEDAIHHTAEAGFDGIDVWGGRPHAYRRDLRQHEIQQLRARMADHGLAVPSFIPAQFRYPTSLCSPNEVIRCDSVAYIQDAIELASGLGAPVVSVCPGHSLQGQSIAGAWTRLRESLTAICTFAAHYGMRIAIEPADRYETDLMNTTGDALRMIDDLGFENLGVLFDTGHALVVGESTPKAIRTLGDRLFHVHVDDNQGQRDQHLAPGEGLVDFDAFLDALDGIGYEGFLCAELGWDYTIDPDPPARETAAFLRARLAAR